MDQGGGRGRGRRGRRGRHGPPHQDEQDPAPIVLEVVPDAEEELVVLNFDIPDDLLNQNDEIDKANRDLADLYRDMNDIRTGVAEMRSMDAHDPDSHNKVIELCIEQYKNLRKSGEELRDNIRRMSVPGIPFEEPQGFDIMP